MTRALILFTVAFLAFVVSFFIGALPALGAEPVDDYAPCRVISAAYTVNNFAVPLPQLLILRDCLQAQMAATKSEADREEIFRAIDRNFSRGDAE